LLTPCWPARRSYRWPLNWLKTSTSFGSREFPTGGSQSHINRNLASVSW
jgi:hypothetical protein